MTKPACSDQIAKARHKMNPDAIKERLKLANAAQKELCAEINRSEDGEFGLGLFDVLQEMYNAGYERAESERQSVIEECCRAVCMYCRSSPPKIGQYGFLVHANGSTCDAAAIRSMSER